MGLKAKTFLVFLIPFLVELLDFVNEPFGRTLFCSLLLAARSLMLKLLNLSEPFGLEVF